MNSIFSGWRLFLSTLKILNRYPVFLVPIMAVWVLYAAITLYLKYFFPWDLFAPAAATGIMFLAFFVFSLSIVLSCCVVLELVQQIETGRPPSLAAAAGETLGRDLAKALPLALLWAVIWFALSVIEALLSGKKRDGGKDDFNTQNAAGTLLNQGDFSWTGLSFNLIKKGVRMLVFLILPAIAWEDAGFFAAMKKGISVLRSHFGKFAAGYALTGAAATIVFLPPGIILTLGTGRHGSPPTIEFPAYVWTYVIIYIGLAWSFCMYIEQMFVASLYLWHMKWEKRAREAARQGQLPPRFEDIPQPVLLDNIPDML
ncbi:MAG: hypothetical protein PHW69_07840 [Elusimicrobiaceae bacterium]|nr:hypothetical protein [Elusimicrobiaceae bacterium]